MPEQQNRVQWIYSSRDADELAERYDQWATDYEEDLARDFEYKGPEQAVEVFSKYVPTDARVLDAGAGTGQVGVGLTRLGYNNLEAMDLSRGMLDEARKKGVYQEYHQMKMGDPLRFPSDSFEAVICVGTLTLGHAPASALDELVRITRPGGYIVFTLRPDVYETNGFKEKHAALEAAGRWKLVEVTEPIQALPKGEPDIYQQVWVYQVS